MSKMLQGYLENTIFKMLNAAEFEAYDGNFSIEAVEGFKDNDQLKKAVNSIIDALNTHKYDDLLDYKVWSHGPERLVEATLAYGGPSLFAKLRLDGDTTLTLDYWWYSEHLEVSFTSSNALPHKSELAYLLQTIAYS